MVRIKRNLSEAELQAILHTWILKVTNAKELSFAMVKHVQRFIEGLKDIPLSEIYQNPKLLKKKNEDN